MTYATHDRHRRRHNQTGERLIIEGPQVFHRPASANQQQHIDLGTPAGDSHGLPQFAGGLAALHTGRINYHRNMRHAPLQGRHHIMQGGGTQRCHDANSARHDRQRALAHCVKQPFGFKFRLEGQELLEKGALACLLHRLDHQLQFTPRLINTETAAQFDQLPIARGKIEQARRTAKHRAADLALTVFQRKITVTAGGTREARDLPRDTDRIEAPLQAVCDGPEQGTHRPDPDAGFEARRTGRLGVSSRVIHLPSFCKARSNAPQHAVEAA